MRNRKVLELVKGGVVDFLPNRHLARNLDKNKEDDEEMKWVHKNKHLCCFFIFAFVVIVVVVYHEMLVHEAEVLPLK